MSAIFLIIYACECGHEAVVRDCHRDRRAPLPKPLSYWDTPRWSYGRSVRVEMPVDYPYCQEVMREVTI